MNNFWALTNSTRETPLPDNNIIVYAKTSELIKHLKITVDTDNVLQHIKHGGKLNPPLIELASNNLSLSIEDGKARTALAYKFNMRTIPIEIRMEDFSKISSIIDVKF